MADPMLAQSAIDRLQNAAYELVVEGDSYRKRQKPRREVPTAANKPLQRSLPGGLPLPAST
jgi:hypothetical protein